MYGQLVICYLKCMGCLKLPSLLYRTSPDSPEDSTFDCLVFESNSEEESEEIIKRIGKEYALEYIL